ncbi:MAG: hypothetical protein AAF962_20865 [Actinomycetota bacterium]
MALHQESQSVRPLADLVVEARQGNVDAVDELCARYQDRLTQVAGSAGAQDPDSVVEKALTQAMLATKGNPMSDTVAFERDVFARVLAAVVPVEELQDDDEADAAPIEMHSPATHWRNIGLEPDPGTDDAWDRFESATAGRLESSWWSTWTVPILGAVIVAGLLAAGALLLLQPETGAADTVEPDRPVGAIADGLRNASDTDEPADAAGSE